MLSGRAKRNLVTVVIIGLLVTVAAILGQQSDQPKATGSVISRTYAQGDPCVVADIALAVPATTDPSEAAETLFEALQPLPGLKAATFNKETSCIEVGFCESETSEVAVRAALQPTGLVAAVDTSATPVAD
jgi:hypothetical protein